MGAQWLSLIGLICFRQKQLLKSGSFYTCARLPTSLWESMQNYSGSINLDSTRPNDQCDWTRTSLSLRMCRRCCMLVFQPQVWNRCFIFFPFEPLPVYNPPKKDDDHIELYRRGFDLIDQLQRCYAKELVRKARTFFTFLIWRLIKCLFIFGIVINWNKIHGFKYGHIWGIGRLLNCRPMNKRSWSCGWDSNNLQVRKNRWMNFFHFKTRGTEGRDLIWCVFLHSTPMLHQQRDICTHVHPQQPQSDSCYWGFHAGSGGFLRHHHSHYSARRWSMWNFVQAETYFTKALLEQSNSFFSPALNFGSKAKMKL